MIVLSCKWSISCFHCIRSFRFLQIMLYVRCENFLFDKCQECHLRSSFSFKNGESQDRWVCVCLKSFHMTGITLLMEQLCKYNQLHRWQLLLQYHHVEERQGSFSNCQVCFVLEEKVCFLGAKNTFKSLNQHFLTLTIPTFMILLLAPNGLFKALQN